LAALDRQAASAVLTSCRKAALLDRVAKSPRDDINLQQAMTLILGEKVRVSTRVVLL